MASPISIAVLFAFVAGCGDAPRRAAYREDLRERLALCVHGEGARPDNACVLELADALAERPTDRRFRDVCERKVQDCAAGGGYFGDLCGPRSRLYREDALAASLACFDDACDEVMRCVRRAIDR